MRPSLLSACPAWVAAMILGVAQSLLAGTTNGTPYSWGLNNLLALPADATNIVAIDASILGPIALRADGTVLAWDGSPPPPPGLSNVVAISAGEAFHVALKADGRPVVWGWFPSDEVSSNTPPAWLTNAVAISAGFDHAVALTADGNLIPWGANTHGVLNAPLRTFNPRSFAAGYQTVLVIEESGQPFGWGDQTRQSLSFPIALSNAVQISASPLGHALGLRSDGRVLAWGNNVHGQTLVPANATNIVQVCAAPRWSLALREDGSVAIWGQSGRPWTALPPDPVRFLSIAASETRNFGLTRAPVLRDYSWSTNLLAGSDITLTQAFIGSDPFEVQWLFNGQPMPGRTNPVLNLTNVQAADVGRYRLVASNRFGSGISFGISITVQATPPRILEQSGSIALPPGTDTSLSVVAAGSDPLTFQWHLNGVPIPSGTNAVLPLPSVGSANEGRYHVIVSNLFWGVPSRPIWLTTGRPMIDREPGSFHGLSGRPVQLEAEVIAIETPSYSWWLGTNRVEGVVGPRLEIPSIQLELEGQYRLVASNSFGAVTSRIAHVSIRKPPEPLREPLAAIAADLPAAWQPGFTHVVDARMNRSGASGFGIAIRPDRTLLPWGSHPLRDPQTGAIPMVSNVTAIAIGPTHAIALFEDGRVQSWGYVTYGEVTLPAGPAPELKDVVEIAAAEPLGFALRANGEVVSWPVAGRLPLDLHGVTQISTSANTVGVLREDGSVWLWNVVEPESPTKTEPLDAVAIAAGDASVFALLRDGTLRQLYRGGSVSVLPPIDGNPVVAEIATLDRIPLARTAAGSVWMPNPAHPGTWQPWVFGLSRVARLASGFGATLAFTDAPVIHPREDPAAMQAGLTHGLAFDVSSSSALRFQWLRDGVVLPTQTRSNLLLRSVRYADAGQYQVVASNERSSVTSAPVLVSIYGRPEIDPLSPLSPLAGEDSTLRPTIHGSQSLTYQWYFGGRALAGATQPFLRLPDIQEESAGAYEVEVSNGFGTVRRSGLQVGVQPSAPRIPDPNPASLTVLEGAPLRLALDVRGTAPIRYQWFHENQPRPDQTNATLFVSAVTPSDAGNWRLQAINQVGSSEGSSIGVAVEISEPRILQQETWRLANAGNPFAWSPTVAGSAPLKLQWKKDGTDIPGATNSTLVLASVSTNDRGFYTLHLSNPLGQAESQPMKLVPRPGNGPGAVVGWGNGMQGAAELGVVQDVAVAAYETHAVLTNGTVHSLDSALRPAPSDLAEVVSVAAGNSFAIALKADGSLRTWGPGSDRILKVPPGLGRVTAIAAGDQHVLALLENGTPVSWGLVPAAQTNVPAVATNLIAISAGGGQNLGLRRDGIVVSWGSTSPAVVIPASASNVIAIQAFRAGGLALRSDLRVVAWGGAPAPNPSQTNLMAVAGGNNHGLGLRANGTVAAWGFNTSGQTSVPIGLSNVVAVFARNEFSAALTRSPVFGWPRTPTVVNVEIGEEVRLAPSVHGLGPMSFQWLANGEPIVGQTNRTLHLGPADPALDASYILRASNPWQTVDSPPLQLTVVGAVQLRWNLTNSLTPQLWVRAQRGTFFTLYSSESLDIWTPVNSYPVDTNGNNIDVDPSFSAESLFYRVELR